VFFDFEHRGFLPDAIILIVRAPPFKMRQY
jgi:hypothetical protein